MLKLIKKAKYASIIFSFFLCFSVFANDKNQLLEHVKNYKTAIGKGNVESAFVDAKIAYELTQTLFKPSNSSRLVISEDYALILMRLEKNKQAMSVLQSILTALENVHGKHAEKLITTLGDLKVASKKVDSELSSRYAARQTRLYLRYNSDEYVDSFSKKTLKSTQQAKNLAAQLSKLTHKNYKILDAGQWDLIYDADSSFNFKQLIEQMDKGYRSALGFLIAFNTLSKPPKDKLKAVFFSSRDDYKAYLKSKKSKGASLAAQRSLGLYQRALNNLYLFDFSTKKTNHLTVFSVLRHEIAHQLFFNLGLQGRSRNIEYPRWLTEGLATSLEFHDLDEISGAHTENYSFIRLNRLKSRMEKTPLTPITKIVAISLGSEGLAGKHNPDIYEVGGFLIKFLYEHHPDKLRKYIQYLTKTNRTKLTRRSSTFYRHFGDRESLQQSFDVYLNNLIEKMTKKTTNKKSN